MLADAEERVTINRRAGEITISFGGDTNQAAQFARSVPDFVLKGRFADLVKLDLQALEQETGFDLETTRPWWRRLGSAVSGGLSNVGPKTRSLRRAGNHSDSRTGAII
jgi:hypothetical protein